MREVGLVQIEFVRCFLSEVSLNYLTNDCEVVFFDGNYMRKGVTDEEPGARWLERLATFGLEIYRKLSGRKEFVIILNGKPLFGVIFAT